MPRSAQRSFNLLPSKDKWYATLFHRLSKLSPESASTAKSVLSVLTSIMSFTPPPTRPLTPPNRTRNRSKFIVLFLKWFALLFISGLVLVALLGSGRHGVNRQVQRAALPYRTAYDIGNPSLKNAKGCPDGMENYVPCYDAAASLKAGFKGGEEYDRHCNLNKERQCIVRPPRGYKLPMKWPASNYNVWSDNVKVVTVEQSSRVLMEENSISFPSEESLMEEYVQEVEGMLSPGANKSFIELGIRLVLDVGCGTGAFASYLLTKNLLTMSISGYKTRGAEAQVAQERGLPAMIGSFSSVQLPYPFSAYDMIHCRSCDVQWHLKDGVLLLEANRLLRPGGYFVWTVSSLNQSSDSLLKAMGKHTASICWSQVAHNEQTIIWQKTTKQRCYSSRRSTIPLCEAEHQPSATQPKLRACMVIPPKGRWRTVQQQHLWPNRLMLSARRLSRYGMESKDFSEDIQSWLAKLTDYWSLFTPVIFSDHPKRPGNEDPLPPSNVVRNVMDMNAQFGGFNAALLAAKKPVWVMNVVPTTAPNTLSAIYDRGLLGVSHDWCEAFPTFPRTYDLLYATSLLSQELMRPNPCGLPNLVLEMDRLLRPEGWILLQDEKQVIETTRSLLVQIRWEARIVEIPGQIAQRLLIGQKNWRK